ncbi:MAG: hypothetical protein HYU39_10595 [Thaumarchaeota archaeon]|nr:hypothetical protein [Nitrososphaerota archaeon]
MPQTYVKWRNRVAIVMIALLPVGAVTLWQVYTVAPKFLFYTGTLLLSAQALTTLACVKMKRWAYIPNAVLPLIVLAGTLSSPAHLYLLANSIPAGFAILVGNILEVALLLSSLKAFRAIGMQRVT